ncbi:hypothetical protein FRC07_012834 [Ceratobasidium sp. 392]|nr:hypothetical protein FRC07_012834 [Ceratobasidium sp. 392]
MVNDSLSQTFEALEPDNLDPPTKFVQGLIEDRDDWKVVEHSVKALFCDTLQSLVKDEAVSKGEIIDLVNAQEGEAQTSHKVNILGFQDHIRNHIKAYADRVEQNHLGSSFPICYDVETAISYVWRRMPEGFGAKKYRTQEDEPDS